MRSFREIRKSLIAAIKSLVMGEPAEKPKEPWWGVHPVAAAAFEAAMQPIERYRSKMASTSQGKHWFPRLLHALQTDEKNGPVTLMPNKDYGVDEHGAVRVLRIRRDKTLSYRQVKRARMAVLRCA